MGILLAFAPFIAFAICDRFVGANIGLIAAAIVSAGLILRGIALRQSAKLLEVGTFVLFAGLAIYAYVSRAQWSLYGVRLWVDAGLAGIVLLTMVVGKPFTLQYARERVDASLWSSPEFLRTNYVITGAWALAFLLLAVADWVLLTTPSTPRFVGFAVIAALLYGAFKFTDWYPQQLSRRRGIGSS
jgi:hypothetical protein